MWWMFSFMCFSFFTTIGGLDGNPCSSSKRITDITYIGSRNAKCQQNDTGSKTLQCDVYLKEGWYTLGNATLLDNCPTEGNCGVTYPIWMNGSFPDVPDGIVNQTVCVKKFGSCCFETMQIQVKNCSDYYVYYLLSAKECASAYCFESSLSCLTPTTSTPATTTPTTSKTTPTTAPSWSSTEMAMTNVSTKPGSTTTEPNQRGLDESDKDKSQDLLIVIIVAVGAVLCLTLVIITILVKKHCRCNRSQTHPTEPPPYEDLKVIKR